MFPSVCNDTEYVSVYFYFLCLFLYLSLISLYLSRSFLSVWRLFSSSCKASILHEFHPVCTISQKLQVIEGTQSEMTDGYRAISELLYPERLKSLGLHLPVDFVLPLSVSEMVQIWKRLSNLEILTLKSPRIRGTVLAGAERGER